MKNLENEPQKNTNALIVIFNGSKGKNNEGILLIKNFSQTERIKRTFKTGGMWLGITIVGVFIPVLHILIVPLGLIATIIGSIYSYKKRSIITSGSGICPECNKKVEIFEKDLDLPFFEMCSNCKAQLRVVKQN